MLRVRGGLSKQDWPCSVFDIITASGDGLAVGFHRQLLEIGREPVEILIEPDPISYRLHRLERATYGETRCV